MARDYAKFVPPKTRTAQPKVWPVKSFVAIFFVAIASSALSFFIYQKAHADKITYFQEIVALLQHKTEKPRPPVKVAEQGPQPVHFDFYSELPNMQLPQNALANESAATLEGAASTVPGSAPATPVMAGTPVIPKPMAITKPGELKKPEVTHPAIFNPSEVDELLADEKIVSQPNAQAPAHSQAQDYIIQLGVFESEDGAQRLIEAIAAVGFQPRVVKLDRKGHNMYQVQQGPYQSMESAKLEQLRLQKRGIISIIRRSV